MHDVKDLIAPGVMFACAFISVYRRFPREKLRSIAICLILLPIMAALGAVPSLIFLLAMPVVLLQHRYHMTLAATSVLPVLLLMTLHLLPPGSDSLWTLLTLVCAYHSSVHAGVAQFEAPGWEKRLLIPVVILSALLVSGLGYVVYTGVGTIVLVLAVWRFRLHSFFDRIGRVFVAPSDVRVRPLRKEL